jgi:hypothetical protein
MDGILIFFAFAAGAFVASVSLIFSWLMHQKGHDKLIKKEALKVAPVRPPVMSIVRMPRGGGKTTLAIEESARTGAVIACMTQDICNNVERAAKEMGLSIPKPLSHEGLLSGRCWTGRRISGFIIDDADNLDVGNHVVNVPVIMKTITTDPD